MTSQERALLIAVAQKVLEITYLRHTGEDATVRAALDAVMTPAPDAPKDAA